MSLKPEQKACRECVFDGKYVCRLMFDKKLGRDNSLVVLVHRYLQHLSLTSAAHVCTSDKRVEAA